MNTQSKWCCQLLIQSLQKKNRIINPHLKDYFSIDLQLRNFEILQCSEKLWTAI